MSDMMTEQLRHLASTLTDLKGRVRHAVAGEVGRAVAEAVGEVLVAVLGGTPAGVTSWAARPGRYDSYRAGHSAAEAAAAWDDADATGYDPSWAHLRRPDSDQSAAAAGDASLDVLGPAALAVAVAASQWWLARQGSAWGAAGAGLAAGATLLAGGPMARTALAVLLAVHRLLAATDALGAGALVLDEV